MQPEEPVLRVSERLDDDGSVVLAVQGEIDLATASTLAAQLTGAGGLPAFAGPGGHMRATASPA